VPEIARYCASRLAQDARPCGAVRVDFVGLIEREAACEISENEKEKKKYRQEETHKKEKKVKGK